MSTSFEEYIKLKGIQENKIYTAKEVAFMLGRSMKSLYSYCCVGRRTKRNGLIDLPAFKVNGQIEIVGRDLIEFLRKSND